MPWRGPGWIPRRQAPMLKGTQAGREVCHPAPEVLDRSTRPGAPPEKRRDDLAWRKRPPFPPPACWCTRAAAATNVGCQRVIGSIWHILGCPGGLKPPRLAALCASTCGRTSSQRTCTEHKTSPSRGPGASRPRMRPRMPPPCPLVLVSPRLEDECECQYVGIPPAPETLGIRTGSWHRGILCLR